MSYVSMTRVHCSGRLPLLFSGHMHFGFWPEDKPNMTLEDAQQLMFETVAGFFPKPPVRVLAVECSPGIFAAIMAKRSYLVDAISPSEEKIVDAMETSVRFIQMGFYDQDSPLLREDQYEAILFLESAPHIGKPQQFVPRARSLLREKGVIIICDEVCYDRSIKEETAAFLASEITTALSEAGFCIVERRVIGGQVRKTCDVVIENMEKMLLSKDDRDAAREDLSFFFNEWRKRREWFFRGQLGYEIFVARKDQFLIKPYTPGDEIHILDMFKEVFRVDRSLAHWKWKFALNPYGTHAISEAFSPEERLVVHYGGYYVPFYNGTEIGPEEFVSYQGSDTMTRPEVRNVGIGRTNLLSRTAHHCFARYLEGRIPFAYGFNTGKIKILGKRYLGYNYFDEVVFRVRDFINNPFTKPYRLRLFREYRIDEIHSFTAEWDDFFERVKGSYKLLVKRDSAYLRWRYRDCPDREYRIFSVRRGKNLVGWSVFALKESTVVWGDALFDRHYPAGVYHLLYDVQALFTRQGFHCMEGWFSEHPHWWNEILDALKISRETEPNRMSFCYKIFMLPDMSGVLEKYLYYTMGDSDLF